MSTMNAARARLNGITASATATLGPYKSQIQLGLYIVVALVVIWSVYTVLFPPPDALEILILEDARKTGELAFEKALPGASKGLGPMKTGGAYTFQTWIYVSSWDYRAGQPKHVFTLACNGSPPAGRPPHHNMVGLLAPNDNRLVIRIYQETEGTQAQSGEDLTVLSNLNNYFKSGGTNVQSIDYPICDITDIDLQRWLCICVVVDGRVVDVYMDGKLARSCVCPGIPTVETPGAQSVILAKANSSFGGMMSTTRFYGYALTPARIYELYQQGPAEKRGLDKKYGFIGWLGERLGLSIDYAGVNR